MSWLDGFFSHSVLHRPLDRALRLSCTLFLDHHATAQNLIHHLCLSSQLPIQLLQVLSSLLVPPCLFQEMAKPVSQMLGEPQYITSHLWPHGTGILPVGMHSLARQLTAWGKSHLMLHMWICMFNSEVISDAFCFIQNKADIHEQNHKGNHIIKVIPGNGEYFFNSNTSVTVLTESHCSDLDQLLDCWHCSN